MSHLPRSTPMEQGVDPAAVLAFVDAVEASADVELHSLMVLRHGHVVAEGWWAPHTAERTRLLYSISKSFTSTALAFAIAEGLLDLDDPVIAYFPELDGDIAEPRSRSITLRHLAAMASGHGREMQEEAMARDQAEPVRGFLLVPPEEAPGSVFAYSQPCTYTIAAVIQRRAGMPLTEYLRPRLLDPLGIDEVRWSSWPPGRELGFSGLFARTEDVAKLGQLYLQRGRWDGRQLIAESYVEEATAVQVASPREPNVDWRQGYGYQFWRSRHGFRGDGAMGQFCVVLPEQDAVVAITGGTEAMQEVLELAWEHLLPGLGAREPDASVHSALEERLRGLRLAPCEGRASPGARDDWSAMAFVVGPEASRSDVTITSVGVQGTDAGVEVTLTEPGNALRLTAGTGDWVVSEPYDAYGDAVPVAASAGWLDDGTLRLAVLFLETPHRMDVACTAATGTAEVSWRPAAPLNGGSLSTLHRPPARLR